MPVSVRKSTDPVGTIKDYGGYQQPNHLLCDGAQAPVASYPALFSKIGYLYGGGVPIATVSRTANVATVTTPFAHGFTAGEIISVFLADPTYTSFNILHTVIATSGPTSSSFTYASAGGDLSPTAVVGACGTTNGNPYFGIPDSRGRGLIGPGLGNYSLPVTTRLIGDKGGKEKHAIQNAEVGYHAHNISDNHYHNQPAWNAYVDAPGVNYHILVMGNTGSSAGSVAGSTKIGTISADYTPAASAHENMHPWLTVTKMIRY